MSSTVLTQILDSPIAGQGQWWWPAILLMVYCWMPFNFLNQHWLWNYWSHIHGGFNTSLFEHQVVYFSLSRINTVNIGVLLWCELWIQPALMQFLLIWNQNQNMQVIWSVWVFPKFISKTSRVKLHLHEFSQKNAPPVDSQHILIFTLLLSNEAMQIVFHAYGLEHSISFQLCTQLLLRNSQFVLC